MQSGQIILELEGKKKDMQKKTTPQTQKGYKLLGPVI